jgi:hypothetical protein
MTNGSRESRWTCACGPESTNWQSNDFGYLARYDGDWHDAEEFSWR